MMFSCEICEIFKNTLHREHRWASASDQNIFRKLLVNLSHNRIGRNILLGPKIGAIIAENIRESLDIFNKQIRNGVTVGCIKHIYGISGF